jgi:hypothetical protein
LNEENENDSQEDVFDEGDISNRRLPHLANISGSIPNQHPLEGIVFFNVKD